LCSSRIVVTIGVRESIVNMNDEYNEDREWLIREIYSLIDELDNKEREIANLYTKKVKYEKILKLLNKQQKVSRKGK